MMSGDYAGELLRSGIILFLVQMQGCRYVTPHEKMDPLFAQAIRDAVAAGVQVIAYDAQVSRTAIQIGQPLAVHLAAPAAEG